CQQHNSYPFSF
nr:immunoglobulin light chain junction region [Macaca mulatta]